MGEKKTLGGEGVIERPPSPPKPTSPKNFPTTLRPMELQTLAPALDGVWWEFFVGGLPLYDISYFLPRRFGDSNQYIPE